jgi:hypothetical protein
LKFLSPNTRTVSATNASVALGGNNNAPITINYGLDEERCAKLVRENITPIHDNLISLSSISTETRVREAIDSQLDRQIDEYNKLINSRKAKTALGLLTDLFEAQASRASHRILFRIKSNIGVCQLF